MSSGGWIKFEKEMANDPRLLEAATVLAQRYRIAMAVQAVGGRELSQSELLYFCRNALLGALVTLWSYADTHIRADDTLPMALHSVDAMVHIEGFCDLMPAQWVRKFDDRTTLLPGYCEHNALIAKQKATIKSNARVTAFRARKKVNGNGVAEAHVTETSTRYPAVTKMVDRDLDQDPESKTKNYTHGARTGSGNGSNGYVTPLREALDREPWEDPPAERTAAPDARATQTEQAKRFFALKADYPAVARADWIGAQKFALQLVLDGQSTWDDLHLAVNAYRAFCAATNRIVMNPKQFFSAVDLPWANAWTIPEQRGAAKKPRTRAKSPEELEAEEAEHAKH
jgi:hypothetical protein